MQLSTSSASRDSQAGFALMEAVIAAAVLMIVILGVLKGLDTANRSSRSREGTRCRRGAHRAGPGAPALLPRGRSLELRGDALRRRQQRHVHDRVQGGVGPRLDRRHRELQQQHHPGRLHAGRRRPRPRASSPRPIAPITMASLVAAPIGAFGTNQGTLGVQVNDRDGAGVPGMPVTITGPATRDQRDELGRLRDLRLRPGRELHGQRSTRPAGSTRAARRAPPRAPPSPTATVSVTTMTYDRAASVQVSFDTVTARDGLVSAKAHRRVRLELLRARRPVLLGRRPAAVGSRRDRPSDLDRRHRDVPVQ